MKSEAVYLAGSMEFVTLEEMKGWRSYVTEQLKLADITTLDPTRRVAMHLNGQKHSRNTSRALVKQDLQDICHSRVLFVNLKDSSSGRKWGTVCEVAHAHTKNKIIIAVIDKDQYVHPFIDFYATEIYDDFDEAIEAVKSYYV